MKLRRPPTRVLTGVGMMMLLSAVPGCGSDAADLGVDTTSEQSSSEQSSTPTEGLVPPTLPDDADPDTARFEEFAAATFSTPTVIDNPYFPLAPGNRIVLSGTTVEDGEELSHQLRYVVTGLTKEILGIETVVVFIEDYSDDELVEAEIAFYAQDDDGVVWFFGEHPEEYEEETLIDAPTWIAGVDGAFPGVAMHADPQPGVPAYFQGWGPAVGWSDFAEVESAGLEICVELGCYADTITIAESSLDEVGIAQLKSYAPTIGTIHVSFRGDDATQEQLEVVDHDPVSASDLAAFNALAKAMEASAYMVSPGVYGATTPMR